MEKRLTGRRWAGWGSIKGVHVNSKTVPGVCGLCTEPSHVVGVCTERSHVEGVHTEPSHVVGAHAEPSHVID